MMPENTPMPVRLRALASDLTFMVDKIQKLADWVEDDVEDVSPDYVSMLIIQVTTLAKLFEKAVDPLFPPLEPTETLSTKLLKVFRR